MNNKLKKITNFFDLSVGDTVWVKCGGRFYRSKVTQAPFWNSDADEPDWEVATTNGFCDRDSIYVNS